MRNTILILSLFALSHSLHAQTEAPKLRVTGGAGLHHFKMEEFNDKFLENNAFFDNYLESGVNFYGEATYRVFDQLQVGGGLEYLEGNLSTTFDLIFENDMGQEIGNTEQTLELKLKSLNFFLSLTYGFSSYLSPTEDNNLLNLFRPEMFARLGMAKSAFRTHNYPDHYDFYELPPSEVIKSFYSSTEFNPYAVIGGRIKVVLLNGSTDLCLGVEGGYRIQESSDLKLADGETYYELTTLDIEDQRMNLDFSGFFYGVSITVAR